MWSFQDRLTQQQSTTLSMLFDNVGRCLTDNPKNLHLTVINWWRCKGKFIYSSTVFKYNVDVLVICIFCDFIAFSHVISRGTSEQLLWDITWRMTSILCFLYHCCKISSHLFQRRINYSSRKLRKVTQRWKNTFIAVNFPLKFIVTRWCISMILLISLLLLLHHQEVDD